MTEQKAAKKKKEERRVEDIEKESALEQIERRGGGLLHS